MDNFVKGYASQKDIKLLSWPTNPNPLCMIGEFKRDFLYLFEARMTLIDNYV